jgi:protein kinase A
VTDFGIARVWRPDNAQDTSGTPGYMGNLYSQFKSDIAPEVMCR